MDRQALKFLLVDALEEAKGESIPHLAESQSLQEDLHLDSLDLVNLAVELQYRLRVHANAEELQSLATVGDLLAFLDVKVRNRVGSEAA